MPESSRGRGSCMNATEALRGLKRHGTPILLGAVLGAALGLAASVLVPVRYTSNSTVLVSPVSTQPAQGLGASERDVDVETEVVLAESRTVGEFANELLDGLPPATVGSRPDGDVEAHEIGDSRMMRISFEADSAEKAHRGAAAYTDAYVAVREELVADRKEEAEDQIENRVEELTFLLGSLPELNPLGRSAEDVATAVERATLQNELVVNQQALAEIRTISTEVATIVDTPQVPSSPSSLSTKTLVLSGAALGIAVGALFALVVDAVRHRREPAVAPAARRAPDKEKVSVPAPSPAMREPAAPGLGEVERRRLQGVLDQVARASASLMPTIHRRVVSGGEALIVVDDDGHSSTAAALALSMEIARRGARTLLVEAARAEPALVDIASLLDARSIDQVAAPGAPEAGGPPYPRVDNLSVLTATAGEVDADSIAGMFAVHAVEYDAVILIAGRASQSALLHADLPAGAAVVATRAPANPANLPAEDLAAIEQSAHQLIGILSIGEHRRPAS